MAYQKKVDYWLRKAGASAVPNMGILSGDSQADMRSFYYSSSRTSTLTREEDDNMTGVDDNINAINSIELFSTTMTTAAVSVPAVIVPMTTILTGGRTKGTTQMASASMQRNIEECIVQSATEYMRVREELQQKNKKASRFTLACIIGGRKEALGIPPGVEINIETVRSRAKRKKPQGKNEASMSPMLEVEPYIIVLIEQLSKMRVPITCRQGLELANSLVSGKSIMENIVLWRQKHCISFREDPTLSKPLGSGYWRGFMSRNWLHVKAKKGVKFDGKRADWCTLRNFEQMYRDVYEEMAKMGIKEKLDEEVWLNKSGDVVANEEGALGMKTKYILKHPNKLIFVDEVGSNTSQAKDGQKGGEKVLCIGTAARPQQRSAMKDAHFTVLGFTAAEGTPVMCAIIFAAKAKSLNFVGYRGLTRLWNGMAMRTTST